MFNLCVKILVGSNYYEGQLILFFIFDILPKISQGGMISYVEGSEGAHNTFIISSIITSFTSVFLNML